VCTNPDQDGDWPQPADKFDQYLLDVIATALVKWEEDQESEIPGSELELVGISIAQMGMDVKTGGDTSDVLTSSRARDSLAQHLKTLRVDSVRGGDGTIKDEDDERV